MAFVINDPISGEELLALSESIRAGRNSEANRINGTTPCSPGCKCNRCLNQAEEPLGSALPLPGYDGHGISEESLMREHQAATGQYWHMEPEQQVENVEFTDQDILPLPTWD